MVKVLLKANLAKNSRQDFLSKDDWLLLASDIRKDFPNITCQKAMGIIDKGIKGLLDEDFEMRALNYTRIYQWFFKEVGEQYTEEEKHKMKFPGQDE